MYYYFNRNEQGYWKHTHQVLMNDVILDMKPQGFLQKVQEENCVDLL